MQVLAQQADGHPDVVLKNAPSSAGEVVVKIPNGQSLQVLADHGEYVLVRWQGVVGFAKANNLTQETLLYRGRCVICSRSTDGGFEHCCRACPASGGMKHGPRCEARNAGHAAALAVAKPPPVLAAVDAIPEIDLWNKQSLVDFMKWANIKLLRGEWLWNAPIADVMRMRQDLPEEAFVPHDELMSRSIKSLTYAWQSAAHPDPEGLVALALKYTFPPGKGISQPEALFWDHKCLFQKEMRPEYDPLKGHDFKDYLVRNRTNEELLYFQRSLQGMHAFFFADYTEGLIIDKVPSYALNATPYSSRGWPLMESRALGLSGETQPVALLEKLCEYSYSEHKDEPLSDNTILEKARAAREGFREEDLKLIYLMNESFKSIDITKLSTLKAEQFPVKICMNMQNEPPSKLAPLPLLEFRKLLEQRQFTGQGDKDLVARLYATGFREYASKATSIKLQPIDLAEAQMAAAALESFTALKKVQVLKLGFHARTCKELKERLQALEKVGVEVARAL